MENDEFSSESDDDDYIPSGEESGDQFQSSAESNDEQNADDATDQKKTAKRKKTLKQQSPKKRSRRNHDENSDSEEKHEVKKTAEEIKKTSDSLWSDFLKDTKSTVKPSPKPRTQDTATATTTTVTNGSSNKEVTKVYSFAGEEVKFKEVGSSKETIPPKTILTDDLKSDPSPSRPVVSSKKPSGLSNIVGKISSKAPKLSTLEKSKLDWNEFKSDEGIEEELASFNKGKDGYLERQAFLQRTDLRQFEIERNFRQFNRR